MMTVLSSSRKGVSQAKEKVLVPESIFKKTKCIVKLNVGYVVWNSLFQPALDEFMVKKTSDVRYFQLKSLKSISTFLSFHGRNGSFTHTVRRHAFFLWYLAFVLKFPNCIDISPCQLVN